ncbi:MAG: hypothetical protein RL154_701 [Pseudomonadota bacterium]
MKFQWDENKNLANLKKHGICFEAACEVFADPMAISIFDPDHSQNEDRYILTGKSFAQLILVVVHTYRDDDGTEIVRIISARKATQKEKQTYNGEV